MQNIIAARGLNALQDGSRTTTGIMQLAQEDNKMMLKFSKQAQDDTRILKTITVLTMVYLPASFVAVSQMLSSLPQVLIIFHSKFWTWDISLCARTALQSAYISRAK
jgi:hypothetical protein